MTGTSTSNAPVNHDSSPQDIERNEVLNAIGSKWRKFSTHELSMLKNIDELVGQIVTKYGLEKTVVRRDDTLMAGRNL
jgi:hypothetical protein